MKHARPKRRGGGPLAPQPQARGRDERERGRAHCTNEEVRRTLPVPEAPRLTPPKDDEAKARADAEAEAADLAAALAAVAGLTRRQRGDPVGPGLPKLPDRAEMSALSRKRRLSSS